MINRKPKFGQLELMVYWERPSGLSKESYVTSVSSIFFIFGALNIVIKCLERVYVVQIPENKLIVVTGIYYYGVHAIVTQSNLSN